MAPPPHEIVILGANFGGIGVTHYLLRHVVPALNILNSTQTYHVTLVGPSDHIFFKIGAPRALLPDSAPIGTIPFEKIFLPIASEFKHYPPSQFTFHQGKAVSLDQTTHFVNIQNTDGSTSSLHYDSLVIATGIKQSPIWSLVDDYTVSKEALASLRQAIPKAKTILIAGGGPAGVETAGEIASAFPKKQITLLSGNDRVLPRLKPATSNDAQNHLKSLRVTVINNVRVSSTSPETPDFSTPTTVTLDDGTTKTVDIYIDATGGKPNSEFLPGSWLDSITKRVLTDPTGLRVHNGGSKDGLGEVVPGVYAIGDVASYGNATAIDISNSVVPVSRSIAIDIAAKVGGLNGKKASGKVFQPKPWVSWSTSMFVSIGPKGGVGQMKGLKMPNFAVWALKARNLMLPMAEATIKGSSFVKP